MSRYDLSVLVPARNEMFLAKTVDSILRNKRGNTEVIVLLDGKWSNPGIPSHQDLTIVYVSESMGQRAGTNLICRLSRAKYIMKIDAHCTVDEGFDIKMVQEMQDDYTMIPMMYNLHAFDWVCVGNHPKSGKLYLDPQEFDFDLRKLGCGNALYQAPTPASCEKCGGNMERLLVWQPRLNKKSTTYRFDKTLHFQYWGALADRQTGDVIESLSAQGSCFMLTREKYWELDICDENHGSWGQQGVEVAMKTWLSGGKLMVNKKTWYSHMFRTQGGDFGFPYPLSGNDVEKARKYSRWLWQEGNWKPAKYDLNWLLDRFAPVPDWHDNMGKPVQGFKIWKTSEMGTNRGILFYTDNQLNLKIAHSVQKQLTSIGLPITSVSLKPMPHFGRNIHLPLERGIDTYFQQIITGLESMTEEIVYMCEHDVIYHPSHFDFVPERKDRFYYNQNFWRIRPQRDNLAVHWDANQVSGLVCYRQYLLDWYKQKYAQVKRGEFDRSYEPGGRHSDAIVTWKSKYPNVDVRHDKNLTRSKWSPNDFRDKSTCINWQEGTIDTIPGWKRENDKLLAIQ